MDSRHTRQMRLAEVGEAGQARIAAASFQAASAEEALYLSRAGAGSVALVEDATPDFVHGGAFRFEASRRVAAGAWRALAQLRRELRR